MQILISPLVDHDAYSLQVPLDKFPSVVNKFPLSACHWRIAECTDRVLLSLSYSGHLPSTCGCRSNCNIRHCYRTVKATARTTACSIGVEKPLRRK